MKTLNFLKLFVFLTLSATLFNSCTKDPILTSDQDEFSQISLEEAGFSADDILFFNSIETKAGEGTNTQNSETASTRNSFCDIEICATFTGTGRYRVILPNGTTIFVNLNTQTVIINGNSFPLINNQLCEVISVPGTATANLGFKGTGSVIVTATYLPNGPTAIIFQAGVGNPNPVAVSQDVTLDCPDVTCEIDICATFTGTGRYRVILPNGTTIFVNLNAQTVTINGVSFPLINNQLCQDDIPFTGISTANLGFKGTGSVTTTATWPDGTVCTIFQAGVGNPNPVAISQDVTISCDPPC